MAAPAADQSTTDSGQLARFGNLTFKIVGGASTAVAASTAFYTTLFSPDTDLLRLLAVAAILFSLITTGIAAALLFMKRRQALDSGEGQLVTPAFPPQERAAARTLLLPFAATLLSVALVLFFVDYRLTPKIYAISLTEGDNEILHIRGAAFGHDPSKIHVKFSQESQEEFVATGVQPEGVDVAVPPKFQKGNISVRRGPRSSAAMFFAYPGVLYDVAVVEMIQPTKVDELAQIEDRYETFPGFPYFSYVSDNPTQWPPRVGKDRKAFHDLITAQFSGEAGDELHRWETHAKQQISLVGDDGELGWSQSYMRLRYLLNNVKGDYGRVSAIVGPHCSQALQVLEEERHKLGTHMPNRLLMITVHNSQIQDIENLSVEIKIGGAVYDATVNEEGEKARSLEWSPDRIDVDIPRVHPGYDALVEVWYYFMGPDNRVFPDAADFEWAKTQGVVIGNMSISNGQLRRSQKLLAKLDAYHRYAVDPVKGSPTFGQEVPLPGAKPETSPSPSGSTSRSVPPRRSRILRAAYPQVMGGNPHVAAEAHVERGAKLYEQGDLDGAIREYRLAIVDGPGLAQAHYLLGLALGYKGDTDSEIAEYRTALRINPKIPDAHLYLGEALERKKHDLDGAITEYRTALSIVPDDRWVHSLGGHSVLASALCQKKDYKGCIAEFRTAIRIKPDNPAPHLGLGMALEEKKDYEGAFQEYSRALALDPNAKIIRDHYDYMAGFLGKK